MFTRTEIPYHNPLQPEEVTNLVFSGGGILGIAYMGVQSALERIGISQQIDNFAGASAGAIYAMLGACEYDATMLHRTVFSKRFPDLLDTRGNYNLPAIIKDPSKIALHIVSITNDLFKHHGLCKGYAAREWFGELIESTPRQMSRDVSFEHLQQVTGKGLYVLGCDLTDQRYKVFSPKNTPGVAVREAVLASMSLPFIFQPKNIGEHWYLDGGTTMDMPLDIGDPFESKNTLGLLLNTKRDVLTPEPLAINSLEDVVGALFGTILRESTLRLFESQARIDQTVFINPLGIDQINFDITDKQKNDLRNSGYDAVCQYFNKLDLEREEARPELLF